jgi:uncharacterized protein YcbK (DUF882 family)
MEIWDQLTHFRKQEAWGDPDKMDHDFLIQLDNFRGHVNHAFRVLCGFDTEGHVKNSYHYIGRAVDGRFLNMEGEPLSLKEHLMIVLGSPFGGAGIYTWSPNGTFLHLDNRPAQFNRKIWICEEKGIYRNLDEAFIQKALA